MREPVPTASGLVAAAKSLAPLIEAEAAQTERSGGLSPILLAGLHEHGLFRMLLPRSLAGHETDPATFVEVLEALACADASTAWVVAQGSGCSLAAAYLSADAAREVFGTADAVLAWGPSGTGARAVSVEGGFRVTGSWRFASGNRHARWIGGHCTVHEPDGRPRLEDDGRPAERTMLFARRRARWQDDWQVMGLAGTGSLGYAVEELLVPAAFTFRRESREERRETGPLYDFSGMSLFALGIAAIALGIARAMLDAFLIHARGKIERTTGRPLRESGAVQADLAKAEARLQSARLYVLATSRELYATAAAGQAFELDQRARLRLSTTWAISQAREAADFAYTAAGADAIFVAGPFERRFRDIHTLSQQVQAHAANFEIVGQALLGVGGGSRLL